MGLLHYRSVALFFQPNLHLHLKYKRKDSDYKPGMIFLGFPSTLCKIVPRVVSIFKTRGKIRRRHYFMYHFLVPMPESEMKYTFRGGGGGHLAECLLIVGTQ